MKDAWTKFLINPQALHGLYDGEPPLGDFELLALSLEDRGPSCFLRGELAQFPTNPKPTWDVEADRLILRLSLSAVERFSGRGAAAGGTMDLTVRRADDGIGVVVAGGGDDFEFEVEGIGLQVIGLTPYAGV